MRQRDFLVVPIRDDLTKDAAVSRFFVARELGLAPPSISEVSHHRSTLVTRMILI